MKLDKKTFKMILSLAMLVMLFAWFIGNIELVFSFLGRVFSILKPIFLGLVIAFLVNIMLRPMEKLWTKLRSKKKADKPSKLMRQVCIVLSLLIVFGVIFAISFIVIPQFTDTVMSFIEKIPEYSDKIMLWWDELSVFLENWAVELPGLQLNPEETVTNITSFIAERGHTVIDSTLGFTANLVSTIANFGIAIVFSIYILGQKESFGTWSKKFLAAMFSAESVNTIRSFFSLVNRTFTSFVTGQLTEAVILGSLCFVGMAILNMPFAPVISVLVGFMSLIPIFGAWIATGIGVFLILLDTPIKAFWFIVFILVLQQFEGNLIYPKVVGKSVGLPALFVLLAVTVGGSAFGILGILVSVPTFSVLYTLITNAVDNRLKEKGISEID